MIEVLIYYDDIENRRAIKRILLGYGLAMVSIKCPEPMDLAEYIDDTPTDAWRGGSRKKGGKTKYRRG